MPHISLYYSDRLVDADIDPAALRVAAQYLVEMGNGHWAHACRVAADHLDTVWKWADKDNTRPDFCEACCSLNCTCLDAV